MDGLVAVGGTGQRDITAPCPARQVAPDPVLPGDVICSSIPNDVNAATAESVGLSPQAPMPASPSSSGQAPAATSWSAHGIPVYELTTRQASLEEAYMELADSAVEYHADSAGHSRKEARP